jgi:hypothetical protein
MSPSLEFLDSFYEKQQASTVRYLADVFCGYSIGDSECKTCPTIPACPKRKATKGTNQQRGD